MSIYITCNAIFILFLEEGDGVLVTRPVLLQIWRVLFPNARLRAQCAISGKCETCSNIHEGRGGNSDAESLKAYSELHAMHRGECTLQMHCIWLYNTNEFLFEGEFFMLERMQYRRRVHHCVQRPNKRLSFIFDGMDQSGLKIPFRYIQILLALSFKLCIVMSVLCHELGLRKWSFQTR